jgi:5-methylcytosine-specific restriction endonuclease McrA
MPHWPRPEPKPRPTDDDRPSAAERGYDSKNWAEFSRQLKRKRGGMCQRCGCELKAYSVTHHIIPIEDGGEQYDESNCEVLCRRCHEKHHGRVKATDFYNSHKGNIIGFKP